MKTIQMTIDEELLTNIDKIAQGIKMSRSAVIRDALEQYLKRLHIAELEMKHREGYSKSPEAEGEFDIWEDEQVWGDE